MVLETWEQTIGKVQTLMKYFEFRLGCLNDMDDGAYFDSLTLMLAISEVVLTLFNRDQAAKNLTAVRKRAFERKKIRRVSARTTIALQRQQTRSPKAMRLAMKEKVRKKIIGMRVPSEIIGKC